MDSLGFENAQADQHAHYVDVGLHVHGSSIEIIEGNVEDAVEQGKHHYNRCRPHRNLSLFPPNGRLAVKPDMIAEPLNVRRRDRLGGLLHAYERAA